MSGLYAKYFKDNNQANTQPNPMIVSCHLNIDNGDLTSKYVIAIMHPQIYIRFPNIPKMNQRSKNCNLSHKLKSSHCLLKPAKSLKSRLALIIVGLIKLLFSSTSSYINSPDLSYKA